MVVQNGKIAIVTDVAGGIGAAIARRLGRDGFSRSPDLAKKHAG